ncbi:hypothetical protein HGRIS_003873 [Hohenbuehelia grisea]|uniref:Protein-lysine N-methyltransferase EFM4 n=1 Tax=Hohenbuehelia grisea TaxID=104357 RepID=A0ABR3JIH5_9AGAR
MDPGDASWKPSKLGTKEHWDSVYETELENFEEIGDEGEVWFGQDSVDKMVEWATAHVPASNAPLILEIGSGNGTLLFALADAEYPQHKMCGVDYSADAVKLATNISASRSCQDILFATRDFLAEDPPRLDSMEQSGGVDEWDLLLDKGTFDAIALASADESGQSPLDGYPARVARLLKPGGFFLITSCNFTEDELKSKFTSSELGLEYQYVSAFPPELSS